METLSGQLKELSPYNALQRGYSILRKNRMILNSIEKIAVEENVSVLMSDGSLDCKVIKVTPNDE